MDADQILEIVNAAIAADRARQAVPVVAAVPVAAVGVKLPDFWTTDPVMWFAQAEAVFRRSNITVSFTKYAHVLMKLPEAVVTSVRNLITAVQPTDTDAYERLKQGLTESYAKTRWQQVFSIIKHPDLGDRRPSAMMNELLSLLPAGSDGDDTLFLGHFLVRLPVSMRDHLAAADLKTAADMAKHADTLWDARAGDSAVSTVVSPVAVVSGRTSPRDNRRRSPDGRQDNRARQPRRATPGPDGRRGSSLCSYHAKWGKKAERCRAPCSWTEN